MLFACTHRYTCMYEMLLFYFVTSYIHWQFTQEFITVLAKFKPAAQPVRTVFELSSWWKSWMESSGFNVVFSNISFLLRRRKEPLEHICDASPWCKKDFHSCFLWCHVTETTYRRQVIAPPKHYNFLSTLNAKQGRYISLFYTVRCDPTQDGSRIYLFRSGRSTVNSLKLRMSRNFFHNQFCVLQHWSSFQFDICLICMVWNGTNLYTTNVNICISEWELNLSTVQRF